MFMSQYGVGILMSLTHVQLVIYDDSYFLAEGLLFSLALCSEKSHILYLNSKIQLYCSSKRPILQGICADNSFEAKEACIAQPLVNISIANQIQYIMYDSAPLWLVGSHLCSFAQGQALILLV